MSGCVSTLTGRRSPTAARPGVNASQMELGQALCGHVCQDVQEVEGSGLRAGVQAGLALPYRSQARAVLPEPEELEAVPEGPCRSVLLRSRMLRSLCTTQEALPHCGLGLPGYVQVTSPIRRYTDLLAHWQLKVPAKPGLSC